MQAVGYAWHMQDPAKLIKRFKSRVHVLDGGLATELEKRGHDISGKLWSAQVLLADPGAIEQLHYDYLKAGADIIITSSYQLTFQGMKEAGYTHEQAEDALWKSVEVAVKARDRYLAELDEDLPEDRQPMIAASIGPYGAYLADGSEYTGAYQLGPPEQFMFELYRFHAARFELLARSGVDLIAFETVPSSGESVVLDTLRREHSDVPVWVSYSCRNNKQMNDEADIELIAEPLGDDPKNVVALGVNCTAPRYVSDLLTELRKNWNGALLTYPNSGESWDAEHRCWVGENDAEHFAEHAREWIKAGANIIGGCCRTGPEHIAQLRALVDSLDSRKER